MRPLTLDEWKHYNTPLPSGSRAKQKQRQPRTRAERQAMIEEIRAEMGFPRDGAGPQVHAGINSYRRGQSQTASAAKSSTGTSSDGNGESAG